MPSDPTPAKPPGPPGPPPAAPRAGAPISAAPSASPPAPPAVAGPGAAPPGPLSKPPVGGAPGSTLSRLLYDALDDTEHLLALFVRKTRPDELDPQLIADIVKTRDAIRVAMAAEQPIDTDMQVAFLSAFQRLAAFFDEFEPGIAQRGQSPEPRKSSWWPWRNRNISAQNITARMKVVTGGILVLLIITNIYWFIGMTVTRDIDRLQSELIEIHTQISRVQSVGQDVGPDNIVLKPLVIRLDIVNARLAAGYSNIAQWNVAWRDASEFVRSVAGTASDLLRKPFEWLRTVPGNAARPADASERPGAPAPAATPQVTKIGDVQSASFVLQALSLYILPLLYGALGSATDILRRMNSALVGYSFTQAAYRRDSIRVMLGAIIGR
jgi:hypothetical protein